MFLPPIPQFSKPFGLLWFWREEQNSEFPKTFYGRYLFAFVEYLCNRSLKIKTKNIKNYSSILAILNQRNWLDNSSPLKSFFRLVLASNDFSGSAQVRAYIFGQGPEVVRLFTTLNQRTLKYINHS